MKTRKGICAIVFRRKGKKKEFLLLYRILRWRGWETLKGGRSPRETRKETLYRELREEIGAKKKDIKLIKKVPYVVRFSFPKKYRRHLGDRAEFQTYLVEFTGRVNLAKNHPPEHNRFAWVSAEKALKMLKHPERRTALRIALRMLD